MNKPLTDAESRLKRLKFRSWHRGWKECDLILGQFADKRLDSLTDSELDAYEQLLEEDDDVIWKWIVGKAEPTQALAGIITMLQQDNNMA